MTVPNSRTQPETPCCAGASVVAQDCSSTASAFGQFIEAVQAPGALDAKTKELMLLTLVIYSRCAPCFAAHLEKARTLGITDEEIEEAAWCAISMGGAPVRMFYREAVRNRS